MKTINVEVKCVL